MKKESKKFYLSVEGETEILYFKHLQSLINKEVDAEFKVKLVPRKNTSPKSFIKTLSLIGGAKERVIHVCDYESNEEQHVKDFERVISELKDIKAISLKQKRKAHKTGQYRV